MNTSTENLLLQEVRPRLRRSIARTVPRVGSEDRQEMLQDGIAIALRLLNNAQRSGKSVTAANVSFYTIKHLRSGRRSTGYKKADAMHPAALLNGRCRVHSLEEHVAMDRSTDEPHLSPAPTLAKCISIAPSNAFVLRNAASDIFSLSLLKNT